jgi:hypothetical protein
MLEVLLPPTGHAFWSAYITARAKAETAQKEHAERISRCAYCGISDFDHHQCQRCGAPQPR